MYLLSGTRFLHSWMRTKMKKAKSKLTRHLVRYSYYTYCTMLNVYNLHHKNTNSLYMLIVCNLYLDARTVYIWYIRNFEMSLPKALLYSTPYFLTEGMKMRNVKKNGGKKEAALEDDLKWVEENIPSTLGDTWVSCLKMCTRCVPDVYQMCTRYTFPVN